MDLAAPTLAWPGAALVAPDRASGSDKRGARAKWQPTARTAGFACPPPSCHPPADHDFSWEGCAAERWRDAVMVGAAEPKFFYIEWAYFYQTRTPRPNDMLRVCIRAYVDKKDGRGRCRCYELRRSANDPDGRRVQPGISEAEGARP